MKIMFTICARAGSKGFKNKNMKEMRDTPLLYYTLAAIKIYAERHKENEVVVTLNTDSEMIVNLALRQKLLDVELVKRKEELAGDTVAKVQVIRDTFLHSKNKNIDLVVDLDITSPMRKVSDIENIIHVFENGKYDLVFSVVEARRSPYFNMVEKKKDGYYRKICEAQFTARQQTPLSYEMNASIYAYDSAFLDKEIDKTILDYNCGISIMQDYLILDIDSEEDFIMMSKLHEYYCLQDSELEEIFLRAKSI